MAVDVVHRDDQVAIEAVLIDFTGGGEFEARLPVVVVVARLEIEIVRARRSVGGVALVRTPAAVVHRAFVRKMEGEFVTVVPALAVSAHGQVLVFPDTVPHIVEVGAQHGILRVCEAGNLLDGGGAGRQDHADAIDAVRGCGVGGLRGLLDAGDLCSFRVQGKEIVAFALEIEFLTFGQTREDFVVICTVVQVVVRRGVPVVCRDVGERLSIFGGIADADGIAHGESRVGTPVAVRHRDVSQQVIAVAGNFDGFAVGVHGLVTLLLIGDTETGSKIAGEHRAVVGLSCFERAGEGHLRQCGGHRHAGFAIVIGDLGGSRQGFSADGFYRDAGQAAVADRDGQQGADILEEKLAVGRFGHGQIGLVGKAAGRSHLRTRERRRNHIPGNARGIGCGIEGVIGVGQGGDAAEGDAEGVFAQALDGVGRTGSGGEYGDVVRHIPEDVVVRREGRTRIFSTGGKGQFLFVAGAGGRTFGGFFLASGQHHQRHRAYRQ